LFLFFFLTGLFYKYTHAFGKVGTCLIILFSPILTAPIKRKKDGIKKKKNQTKTRHIVNTLTVT
jgi:hypothetical protein